MVASMGATTLQECFSCSVLIIKLVLWARHSTNIATLSLNGFGLLGFHNCYSPCKGLKQQVARMWFSSLQLSFHRYSVESCLIVQGENFNVDLKLETSVNASDVVDSLWMKEGRSFACSCSQRLWENLSFAFLIIFGLASRDLLSSQEIYWSSSVHIWFICFSSSKLWTWIPLLLSIEEKRGL